MSLNTPGAPPPGWDPNNPLATIPNNPLTDAGMSWYNRVTGQLSTVQQALQLVGATGTPPQQQSLNRAAYRAIGFGMVGLGILAIVGMLHD
jgi:ABC-type transport system involved in cytochrome c biogenesis permease subunit